MNTISLERALQEVCKYMTKTESFLHIPPSELMPVLQALKRKRLVEPFGECRPSKLCNRPVAYVHTHNTNDGGGRGVPPLRLVRKRRPPLRKHGAEMISMGKRSEWQRYLHKRVKETREFRRSKLAEAHRRATFSDLAGKTWYGTSEGESILQAPACVKLFSAMEVDEFAVTMLKDRKTTGRATFYPRLRTKELLSVLRSLIDRNGTAMESLIIRPKSENFIQVDDCTDEQLQRLGPLAFLAIETSLGNYQVWLALPHGTQKSERDAIRRRLYESIKGVDRAASGALRCPGSINHKPGRNRFRVRIVSSNAGRYVTASELVATGLLVPLAMPIAISRSTVRPAFWNCSARPDYQQCVIKAGLKKDGSPDRSMADWHFSYQAIAQGWSESEVEAMLHEVSDKAQWRPDYARRTVERAASSVARRQGFFNAVLQQLRSVNDGRKTA